MTIKYFVLATSLLAAGTALSQNTTTSGDLSIQPTVVAPGSILNSGQNPTNVDGPPAPVSDRSVKPAGAAIDASSERREPNQTLNATSPRVPLGNTRPINERIDQPVPLGANDNGYRPSSSSGYYDNSVDRKDREVAPSITTPPAPVDPIRPTTPPGVMNPPGDPD